VLPFSSGFSVLPSVIQKQKYFNILIIILPVVLCACETWSLELREEHRVQDAKENT
jgi:hypothetical protein